MKKGIIILACAALLVSSCASEFNSVYKYGDTDYKYEYAKEAFACGKFQQATSLLEELVTIKKGSDEAQECLYMLGMAQYCNGDYEAAQAWLGELSVIKPELQADLDRVNGAGIPTDIYFNMGPDVLLK